MRGVAGHAMHGEDQIKCGCPLLAEPRHSAPLTP
jgi:hypothetical protein